MTDWPSNLSNEGPMTASPTYDAENEDSGLALAPAATALVSRLKSVPLSADAVGEGLCVICADNFIEVGTPIVTLNCGHSYHEGCIREWLTRQHTCPTCRLAFEVDDAKYLRSIGLIDEARAVEESDRLKQEKELAKQAADRKRWIDSMRKGEPVHFGLTCGDCAATPLVGDCYQCESCEGFFLCQECYAQREAAELASSGICSPDPARETPNNNPQRPGQTPASPRSRIGEGRARVNSNMEHHADHIFLPFGSPTFLLSDNSSAAPGVLTVLVPARSHSADEDSYQDDDSSPDEDDSTAWAAAEVAFAAVRSLALAPLATTSWSQRASTTQHAAQGLPRRSHPSHRNSSASGRSAPLSHSVTTHR